MTGRSAPLAGKRVVVTRAPHQAADLSGLLRERGAVPLFYPCIDIASPEDVAPLDAALRAAADGGFDWLVLTSQNTALALSRHLGELGIEATALRRIKVAAVGPATAEAVEKHLGLRVRLLPDEYVAESLVEALRLEAGARILLPQANLARPVLAEGLAAAGMDVAEVVAYRTVIGSGGDDVPRLLARKQIDVIAFTSSSTVENFFRRLANEGGGRATLSEVCIACLGPATARTARDHGLSVAVVPAVHTLEGLVAGLETYFSSLEVETAEGHL